MASSSRPRSSVLALFGPTASGKTAVAGILRQEIGAEVISADSAALYEGLPILTAAPPYPARLVGVVPLDEDVSVGAYQRLAHEAIDAADRPLVVRQRDATKVKRNPETDSLAPVTPLLLPPTSSPLHLFTAAIICASVWALLLIRFSTFVRPIIGRPMCGLLGAGHFLD